MNDDSFVESYYLDAETCNDIVKLTMIHNTLKWWWQRRAIERMVGEIAMHKMLVRFKTKETIDADARL